MLFIYYGRPTIRPSILGPEISAPSPEPKSTPALVVPPNNNFFQKFMKTFIKNVQTQAALAALVEARDKAYRLLKLGTPIYTIVTCI